MKVFYLPTVELNNLRNRSKTLIGGRSLHSCNVFSYNPRDVLNLMEIEVNRYRFLLVSKFEGSGVDIIIKIRHSFSAGSAVDDFIQQLIPLLEPGDIIIDGGNSEYVDTNRRTCELKEKKILYIGTGVSGGEDGARYGPSLMPGGNPEAWPHVKDIFQVSLLYLIYSILSPTCNNELLFTEYSRES